jgi:hypothetical protein
MSDVEKQESQKTVVAFITGLLIGGLLVWVFSSSPEEKKLPTENQENATEEVAKSENTTEVIGAAKNETAEVIGEGSIVVPDQTAGTVVTLGELTFPTKSGWVVVRDYMDGVPANVLGAARYSAEEGLTPTTVELMRGTTAGGSYQVVFFTNAGESSFSISEDQLIDGISATFKAN